MDHTSQLWGGRFTQETDQILAKVNNSLDVDKRLFNEDIDGSIAYAKALCKASIMSEAELIEIVSGLESVRLEWIRGIIEFIDSDEDVHTVNERRLIEIIGPVGGKLHTGRSRNDQVVTDLRMWMKKSIADLQRDLCTCIKAMTDRADQYILMPGYTHLQPAQPIYLAHWLLSHAFFLKTDIEKLQNLKGSVGVLPLGSGALAGNPFNIDREFLARTLQFEKVSQNSMNAVSDRDFVAEFTFYCSLIALHLTRLSEDFIIFASKEFGYINIAESFSTGSSLMPQKRNPDSLELVRGTSGTIFGQHCGFMMTMKALPSTYNKDLQADKVAVFSAYDNLKDSLALMKGVLQTFTVNKDKCERALTLDMLATDLAYYLVRKQIPFRKAHHYAGEVVALAEQKQIPINKIPLSDMKNICEFFDADIAEVYNFRNSVEQYKAVGGTSSDSIKVQKKLLQDYIKTLY